MKIEFTGRQMEVGEEVRRLAERKLQKLQRLVPAVTRAHVTLAADKHRRVAEVSVHSRHMDLAAVEVTTSAIGSVAGALDKLLRQAQRQRARRQERKGAATPRVLPPAPAGEAEGGPPRVIRSRRAAVKPMTLDEAALEMEARPEGVLVFRDAGTGRVSVLFRRKDGNLGLVEPEA